jgi:uncharacterized protein
MKRLARLCTALFAALAACQPQGEARVAEAIAPPESECRAERSPEEPDAIRPALWKVADEDTTIYVFGTVHVLPDGIDWFHGCVAQAFGLSGELVTETVGADPLAMQALVMDKAVLKDGATLRSLLTDEERAAYEAVLKAIGAPPSRFDIFEPWYASVALSLFAMMQEGFSGEHGVEKLLEARARERGIPHAGLETADFQLAMFDTLPPEVQKTYLAEVVSELPQLKGEINAIIAAWKAGNAEELARRLNTAQSDPLLVERLLTSRNRTWAAWIAERLEQPGTVFLAVGAGHLAGEGSLQEQLAAAGIASTRLQ